ncbi:MAG: extracellular solute-binding protein [Bacilli bacterium]|nr:extracellular solute-binding protein [Bacilli bacterium]
MKRKTFVPMALSLLCLSACGGGKVDPNKTTVEFWGWGDEVEVSIFKDIVKKYNANNKDDIYVKFSTQPASGYAAKLESALRNQKAPEIFFVGDADIKKYVANNWLEDITGRVEASASIKTDEMWQAGINRYRYNATTHTSTPSDPLYCLPKDLGPSVIFYNEDAFKAVGINIVSKKASEIAEEDERHGFYEKNGQKYFNNKISMTKEEELALSKLLTKSHNASSPTNFGFYTEWWFNYVWSMGGDCIKVGDDGYYHWTLGDQTKSTCTYEGTTVSTRDVFQQFVDLSTKDKVMPKPSSVPSSDKTAFFEQQYFAMMVGIRANVAEFRQYCDFNWNVAPLSHYEGGTVEGHSGSMGYGMSKFSSDEKKNAAFKFMEYMAGAEGQTELSKTGFSIPNQKELAKEIIREETSPSNAEIFLDYVETQRGGDWTFLPDTQWIDLWAGALNQDVLNGDMTLDTFFANYQSQTDATLKLYGKVGE